MMSLPVMDSTSWTAPPPLPWTASPWTAPPPSRSTSGQYESYWNAFLFYNISAYRHKNLELLAACFLVCHATEVQKIYEYHFEGEFLGEAILQSKENIPQRKPHERNPFTIA